MKPSRILPAAVLAVALVGTGALVATAQDSATLSNTTPAASGHPMPMKAGFRGDDHERGERMEHRGDHERGERGEHRGGRGGPAMFMDLFGQVDADGDGAVTQDEIDAFRTAKIGAADTSGDGALSIEEFETLYREFTRARMVDAFQSLDADGDGTITEAEIDNRVGFIVDRLDRDGDGVLTLQTGRRG